MGNRQTSVGGNMINGKPEDDLKTDMAEAKESPVPAKKSESKPDFATNRTEYHTTNFMERCLPCWRRVDRGSIRRRAGRLVDRMGPMRSSVHDFHVEQQADKESWAQILDLYAIDWFHVLLTMPWVYVAVFVAGLQFLHIILFSGFYQWLNNRGPDGCSLNSEVGEDDPFIATFGFSLITMGTVGYGTIDNTTSFFSHCPWMPFIMFLQTLIYISLDGFLINLFYQRLGRVDPRSRRVLFSRKAVIRHINGHFYFSFQIYDLEKHIPLIEAHCRSYVVKKVKGSHTKAEFQCQVMRMQNPDDELNATIFMGLPIQVLHRIDYFSPLMPKKISTNLLKAVDDNFLHSAQNRNKFPCLVSRSEDSRVGSKYHVSCPVCGNCFLNDEDLLRHVRYSAELELVRGINGKKELLESKDLKKTKQKVLKELETKDCSILHCDLNESLLQTRHKIISAEQKRKLRQQRRFQPKDSKKKIKTKTPDEILGEIQRHLLSSDLEIITIVEAIEPSCAGTLQARCSYKFEDIEFDHWFSECVYKTSQGKTVVDLNKFNDTIEAKPAITCKMHRDQNIL